MNGFSENGHQLLEYNFGMEVTGYKVFNDSVHGHITLHPLLVKVVDTPEFQRLRNIKQVGFAYYVFPGASHCRFEHSLGTCYLAGQLVEKLLSREQRPRTEDNKKKMTLCVQLAALCHDLGHGPFSHSWEILTKMWNENENWKHENCSLQMFDYLVKKNRLEQEFQKEQLGDKEIRLIKEFIMGEPDGQEPPALAPDDYFFYEIVSNNKTGIDVDKWDYFLRDGLHLNLRITFDYRRLLEFCTVLPPDNEKGETHIAFRDKEIFNLYDMYRVRSELHHTAYRHLAALNVELMCLDAFKAAGDAGYKINNSGTLLKEAHRSPESMSELTDHVFYDILYYSKDDSLAEAQHLLRRVLKRDLYIFVGNVNSLIPENLSKEKKKALINERTSKLKMVLEKSFVEPNALKFDVINFYLDLDSTSDPVRNAKFYNLLDKKSNHATVKKQDYEEIKHILQPFPFQLTKEGSAKLIVFCKSPNVDTDHLKKAQEIIRNIQI